jgi:hypothetical protein
MSNFGWDYPAGCHSVPGDESELPETCPCGKENANEEGEPVHPADPAYCSEACALAAAEAQAVADRLEAQANAECDALLELVLGPQMPFVVGMHVRGGHPAWGDIPAEVLRVEGDRLLVQDLQAKYIIEWWQASKCTLVYP